MLTQLRKPKVEITLPVYNEEKELEKSVTTVVNFCKENLKDYDWHITIADNASTDSTPAISHELAKRFNQVSLYRLDKKGRGRAVKEVWTKSGADYCSYMDIDLSTDLVHLPRIIKALVDGYDIAIGSRLKKGARVEGRTLIREFTSRTLNFVFIRIVFGTHFADAQCGFKAVSRKVVTDLLPNIKDNGWFFDGELLIVGEKSGYKVYEEPVHWIDNPGSTVQLLSTITGDLESMYRLRKDQPWKKFKKKAKITISIMDDISPISITKRTVHGVIALTSRTFVLQMISFVAFVLIASKLSVRDIGIYTAVTAIQRVISFITDFGFGAALVQKKDAVTKEDIMTTFTLQLLITSLVFIAVFLLKPFFMSFFHLTIDGGYLLLALVFSIFLSSFKTVPSILMERDIQFNKVVIPQIVESLAFNIVLIALVLNKFGLASYTWAFLAAGFVSIPVYYYLAPWPLKLGISKGSLHHLRFGLQFQAKNILATIKDDFLTVILTKFLSYTDIGYIGFAQRLSFFMYRFIVDSVTKVTFSSYARMQHDVVLLRKAIEKSLFYVSACMFPMIIGLILVAPYVVMYYPKWHNKWEPAIFSLIFFSLNALISSLSGILVNVLDSNGKVKLTLQLMVFWTGLTWILTPLAIHLYGYNGVALASFIVTLTIVITIRLVKRVVMFSFIKSILQPFIATIIMGSISYFFEKAFVHDILTLICFILISGLIYLSSFYTMAHAQLKADFLHMRRKHE